jgi:hypothetical protein
MPASQVQERPGGSRVRVIVNPGVAKGSDPLEKVRAIGPSISSTEPTRSDLPPSVTLTQRHDEILGLRRHRHDSASEPSRPGREIRVVNGDSIRILVVIVEHDSSRVQRHTINPRRFSPLPLRGAWCVFRARHRGGRVGQRCMRGDVVLSLPSPQADESVPV